MTKREMPRERGWESSYERFVRMSFNRLILCSPHGSLLFIVSSLSRPGKEVISMQDGGVLYGNESNWYLGR